MKDRTCIRYLSGRHPERGRLWAAVDGNALFTSPEVRPSRVGSMLAPYPTAEGAEAALNAAGANVDREIHG